MPIYEFVCKKCEDVSEELMGYNDPRPTRCKKCKGKLAQKFSTSSIKVEGTHKTLGSLADANSKKMTEEQRQIALDQSRTKKKFDPRLGPKDPEIFTALKHKPGPKTQFSKASEIPELFKGTDAVSSKNLPKKLHKEEMRMHNIKKKKK